MEITGVALGQSSLCEGLDFPVKNREDFLGQLLSMTL